MTRHVCSIDGCGNGGKIMRGWCKKHYNRWYRHGDPHATSVYYGDPEAAFLARTEPLLWSGCVVWRGTTSPKGYGQLYVNGRKVRAHRYAWEREHGPIPDGLYVDHACWEPSCVNVDHLRLATPQENQQNRSGARKGRKHDLPRGVRRSRGRYSASVKNGGISHHLGTFDTPEEASAVAAAKRAEMFGEFAGRA